MKMKMEKLHFHFLKIGSRLSNPSSVKSTISAATQEHYNKDPTNLRRSPHQPRTNLRRPPPQIYDASLVASAPLIALSDLTSKADIADLFEVYFEQEEDMDASRREEVLVGGSHGIVGAGANGIVRRGTGGGGEGSHRLGKSRGGVGHGGNYGSGTRGGAFNSSTWTVRQAERLSNRPDGGVENQKEGPERGTRRADGASERGRGGANCPDFRRDPPALLRNLLRRPGHPPEQPTCAAAFLLQCPPVIPQNQRGRPTPSPAPASTLSPSSRRRGGASTPKKRADRGDDWKKCACWTAIADCGCGLL